MAAILPQWLASKLMRVIVLSASTGELVWDYTSGSFRQARGWELRMWLCEAIHCAQYFSVILLARQLLLCDMALIREYADGDVLTVYTEESLTRRIMTRYKLHLLFGTQTDSGFGRCCREGYI